MKKVIVGNNGVIVSSGKALCVDALPDGYTRLQYISASGKSAAETGIIVQSTDKVLLTFELANLSAGGNKFIISCRQGFSGGGIWVETYDSYNQWYVRFGSAPSVNTASTQAQRTGVHTFEVRKNYFAVDGTQILTPNYTSMPSTSLNIGGRLTTEGTTATGFYGNIYDVKIVDGDGILRWWGVPAKNQNNVAGLYDLVNDNFHPSETSYAFTAGPSA